MWDEKKIRIVDVADELGVSTATVSNVLHGKTKKVSEKTIKRVQKKLQESGYIPNMAATLLAQNDSRIVGVVVHDHTKYEGHLLEDPFVSGALNALSDEIEASGYFMMLKKTKNIMDAVPFASMWNMEGMILLGFCEDDYQELRDRIRIPFVIYDGVFENHGNVCNLVLDERDGGRQAGEYLKNGGHTKVLCIADNKVLPDYDRYLGLCDGLLNKADFWVIPMKRAEREKFYDGRINKLKKYTAVFAVSDYYAVDLMYYLMGKGFSVPGDISVIGFDDTSLSTMVKPTLSTVGQDVIYRAKKAMEYLIEIKGDNSSTVTHTVPVKLKVRESSRVLFVEES